VGNRLAKPSLFNLLAGIYGKGSDNDAPEPPYRGARGTYHMQTSYGDGTPIPVEYLEILLEIDENI